MSEAKDTNRLRKLPFALSLGTLWGLAMFILGLCATWWDYGVAYVKAYGSIYVGFEPTIAGAFWGLFWGFIDFFILGFLIALLYNWFSCCCKCWKK